MSKVTGKGIAEWHKNIFLNILGMGTKVLTQNKSSCWSYFIRLNEGSTRTYTKKIEKMASGVPWKRVT